MSTESDLPTTAAADGESAATEGALIVHAVAPSPTVMVAGTRTCARCASYVQELGIANEGRDAIQQAMTKMENDIIVSTELANQREQQMFTLKSESEASVLKLQGDYEILKQRLQLSEQEALHARSELEQATENNFCFDPVHKRLQDDLDSAQSEIIEARANETILEEKIGSLKEKVAEAHNRSASALGRKVIQGRRESSGVHPTLHALLEEENENQKAEGEQ